MRCVDRNDGSTSDIGERSRKKKATLLSRRSPLLTIGHHQAILASGPFGKERTSNLRISSMIKMPRARGIGISQNSMGTGAVLKSELIPGTSVTKMAITNAQKAPSTSHGFRRLALKGSAWRIDRRLFRIERRLPHCRMTKVTKYTHWPVLLKPVSSSCV